MYFVYRYIILVAEILVNASSVQQVTISDNLRYFIKSAFAVNRKCKGNTYGFGPDHLLAIFRFIIGITIKIFLGSS